MDANFISIYDEHNHKYMYFVQRLLGKEIKLNDPRYDKPTTIQKESDKEYSEAPHSRSSIDQKSGCDNHHSHKKQNVQIKQLSIKKDIEKSAKKKDENSFSVENISSQESNSDSSKN